MRFSNVAGGLVYITSSVVLSSDPNINLDLSEYIEPQNNENVMGNSVQMMGSSVDFIGQADVSDKKPFHPHADQCIRREMSTLHEQTDYSREGWRRVQMPGLEFDELRIRKAQSNLPMQLRDNEWMYNGWETTFHQLGSLLTSLFSDESATWRLYEMKGLDGQPNDDCASVQSYEVTTGNCHLEFTGDTLYSAIKPLAQGSFSSIFSARAKDCQGVPNEVVIKYANNCIDGLRTPAERYYERPDRIKTADESVMEYAVLRIIDPYRIAPRVYSLSAPSVPQGDKAWNFDSRPKSELVQSKWLYCSDQKAMMRAIVQDKIFTSVLRHSNRLEKDIEGMRFVIRSGRETLQMLGVLHEAGFIHGDIHSGNVALNDDTGRHFSLIDFGLAKFFPVEIGTTDEIIGPITVATNLLSPWHLDRHRLGRRDDIFRAIEMVAFLLTDWGLLKDQEGTRTFKATAPYFTREYTVTISKKLKKTEQKDICTMYGNPEGCGAAMNHLDLALGAVRETPTTDSRPSYGKILDHFTTALESLGDIQLIQQ
jgi:serine/threonine protein kinase